MYKLILCNNYFKKHYSIKKMLINLKVDNITKDMKKLNCNKINFKNNDDYYNDNTRYLDNLLYKYIKYDITLDQNDYKFLKKNILMKNLLLIDLKY